MLEPGNGPQEFQLNIFGKGRGQPLQVELFGMEAAGLDEDLVPLFFREADDLIFNGRAVPGADAFDLAAVEGRTFQIGKDDLPGLFTRIRNITDRFVLRCEREVIGEADEFLITVLDFEFVEVYGPGVDPGRRAGLEAAGLDAEPLQRAGEFRRGEEAVRAGGIRYIAHVNASSEERAGSEDDGLCRVDRFELRGYLPQGAMYLAFLLGSRQFRQCLLGVRRRQRFQSFQRVAVHLREVDDLALAQVQVLRAFEHAFHISTVVPAVDLRAGRVDRRSLAEVQHAGLDEVLVRRNGHFAAEGVDLPDEVSFGRAADGRVAGHVAHPVSRDGEDRGLTPEACRCEPRLNAGVACADDGNVIMSGVILQINRSFCSISSKNFAAGRTSIEMPSQSIVSSSSRVTMTKR